MARLERIRRLLMLLELLQSGQSFSSAELGRLCGVSRRTVFRDLTTLGDCGLQVMYDSKSQRYRMPATLPLPPTEFSVDELTVLGVLCSQLAGGHTGVPFQDAGERAATKVASALPERLRKALRRRLAGVAIHLGPHCTLENKRPIYEALLKAIADRRQIRIDFNAEHHAASRSTLLSPYRLVFRWRSWYVVGRSSLHRRIRTFELRSISKAEPTDNRFSIPPRFSLSRYFGNAWFLNRDRRGTHRVLIRFDAEIADEVASIRWHKTQKIRHKRDGSIEFRATVDGLQEIASWVLGYGSRAEVIQPRQLRDLVRNEAERMAEMYRTPTIKTRGSKRARRRAG